MGRHGPAARHSDYGRNTNHLWARGIVETLRGLAGGIAWLEASRLPDQRARTPNVITYFARRQAPCPARSRIAFLSHFG